MKHGEYNAHTKDRKMKKGCFKMCKFVTLRWVRSNGRCWKGV